MNTEKKLSVDLRKLLAKTTGKLCGVAFINTIGSLKQI